MTDVLPASGTARTADVAARIDRARLLHTRAVAASSALRPAVAERLLTAALRELDRIAPGPGPDSAESGPLRVQVRITLAKVAAELRGLTAGLDVLAGAAADEGLVDSVRTALHNQHGVLSLRFGRARQALGHFDRAETYFGEAPVLERANVLLNRGTAQMMLGALGSARTDLQRCVDTARAGELRVLEFMALHNLGYVDFLAGDLTAALSAMDRAAGLGVAIEGVPLLDRARVLSEAGLVTGADDCLARAAAIFARDRAAQDLAETELERARLALVVGDVAAALRMARRARGRFRRRQNDGWRRSAELVVLQCELAAGRPADRVAASAESLHRELGADGLRLQARMAALITAEASLTAGRVGIARSTLDGTSAPRRDDPITGRMYSHYVHARLDAAGGRTASATRRVRRALDELARYQAGFGSIDLRTAAAVHGRRLAELDLGLALDGGRPSSIFAAAERARAVSSRLPTVRPPADPVAAELLAELRRTVESLRAVELDRAASAPLLRRRRELEREITARTWTVAGAGDVARPVSLEQVCARLAERERAMVTYIQARERLWAVVVDERVRVHELGPAPGVIESIRRVRADLDVLAQPRLHAPMRGAVRASLHRSLVELDRVLIAPLGAAGPLVLVSTGVLGQVPWASLPSLRGVSLVVGPSATKWFASTAAQPRHRGSVVAVAGPGLGRAADEIGGVTATWGNVSTMRGAEASCAGLVAAMADAAVLHVAAHGVHQPENPLFSSVRMADGPVFAHELDRAARVPEHVVLSACEVGLATVRPGDEALGLASVLLQLGTVGVIAGVARVNDQLAARTMAAYHAKLATGHDSAAALAAALTEVDSDVVAPFVNFGAAWQPDLAAVRRVP